MASNTNNNNNNGANGLSEEVIVQRYQQLRQDCLSMVSRISELENEMHEHQLVARALQPLNGDRRCHRLIGGALVERTVAEVLPEIEENVRGIQEALEQLNKMLTEKQNVMEDYARKHGISVAQQQGQLQQGAGNNSGETVKKPDASDPRGVLV